MGKNIFWRKFGVWHDKRRAAKVAKTLREPGENQVRARVVKEVCWRVEYADLTRTL